MKTGRGCIGQVDGRGKWPIEVNADHGLRSRVVVNHLCNITVEVDEQKEVV